METLTKYAAVAAGGALGAMLRYYVGGSALARVAAPFPTATFVINVTGSFVLGLFLTLAAERVQIAPHLRLAVAIGFVGAYTTFSTFEWETVKLIEGGEAARALLYVALSFAVGLFAVWLGIAAARTLGPASQVGRAAHVGGPPAAEPPALVSDVEIAEHAHPFEIEGPAQAG